MINSSIHPASHMHLSVESAPGPKTKIPVRKITGNKFADAHVTSHQVHSSR